MGQFIERLQGVRIESRCAVELIREYGDDPETLIYCDPPYTANTRTGQGTDYLHDTSDDLQSRFLDAITGCRSRVAVSGYDDLLYDLMIGHWRKHKKDRPSCAAKGKDGVVQRREEVLWMNYNENGVVL